MTLLRNLIAAMILFGTPENALPEATPTAGPWSGDWVAYQVTPLTHELQEQAKRCVLQPYLYSTLSLRPGQAGRYAGEMIVTAGLRIIGARGVAIDSVAQLIERCRILGSRDPLAAERNVTYTVLGQVKGDRMELKVTFRECNADWCDGNAYGWPMSREEHTRWLHLDADRLVMDNGASGMGDDIFYFWSADRYDVLVTQGERVALDFLDDLAARRYAAAAGRLDPASGFTAPSLEQWTTNVLNDLGGSFRVTTLWKQAMTYPDPKDPNEYMISIFRLIGPNEAYLKLYCFVQGPKQQLRMNRFWGIGH